MYLGRVCFFMFVINIFSFCFYFYYLCYIKGLEKWVFFNFIFGFLYIFVLRSFLWFFVYFFLFVCCEKMFDESD